MNYLVVNDKKEAFCEQRVFYINENKFEKLRVSIPKALLGSYTAFLVLKVNNLETPFELNMSEIKGCMVSQEIEITEEFTIGSGYIRAWVEFRQGENLGMTNSVVFEIDNVETNAPVNPPVPIGSGVQDVQINNRTVVDSTGVAKILSKSNYTDNNKLVTESDIDGFITRQYVDSKISEEVTNRNNAISQHNSDETAHPYIRGLFDNYYTKEQTDTQIENHHDSTKQNVINENSKLNADLVDDTNSSNKFVNSEEKSTWNSKQDELVSGTNIKTINGESILGSGNIETSGGEQKVDDVKVNNVSVLTNKIANIDLTPYALLGSGNTFEHEQEIKGGMYSGVKVINSSDNQNYAVIGYEGIQTKSGAGQTTTNIPFDEIATIDDTSTTSLASTWSASKLNTTIGNIESLMANLYNGGGAV